MMARNLAWSALLHHMVNPFKTSASEGHPTDSASSLFLSSEVLSGDGMEECSQAPDGSRLCEAVNLLQMDVAKIDRWEVLGPDTPFANTTRHAAIFESFLRKHQRAYTTESPDYERRRELFLERAAEASRHNAQENRLWTAAINKLADRTDDELKALLGWAGHAVSSPTAEQSKGFTPLAPAFLQLSSVSSIQSWGHSKSLPRAWSWGHLNATRRVHNQGSCGSCWAVASASVLQAHMEIHTPWRARWLSMQELVSCVENPHQCGGAGACDGATPELAMDYVMRYGLASAPERAPEVADADTKHTICPEDKSRERSGSLLEHSGSVRMDISAPGVREAESVVIPDHRNLGMRAWERLPPNSYQAVMHALLDRGPLAVAVFASRWFPYSHGIFNDCQRNAILDHAVTLLGYGHDRKLGAKYWLVQNSWGSEWGELGRIRLLRRDNDQTAYCGLDSQPELGTGCDDGPKEVKVCGMCGILYDAVVPHF